MGSSIIEYIFNNSMVAVYLAVAGIGATVTAVFLTVTINEGRFKATTVVLGIFTLLFVAISVLAAVSDQFIPPKPEDYQEQESQSSVDNTTETTAALNRKNGSTTIIQERNKGNCYDDYEEVKVTSDYNDDFSITNCGTVNISGSHNDGFTISNCESVIVSSHNNSFVIKSCKEVEISGSHCDAIIIIDCPSVKVLDGYNKIYLVNSKLKQDKGKDNQIQKMTIEDLKNSDMGYLVEDN